MEKNKHIVQNALFRTPKVNLRYWLNMFNTVYSFLISKNWWVELYSQCVQSDGVLKNSCVYNAALAYMQFIVFKLLVKTEDLLFLQILHSLEFHSLISILKRKKISMLNKKTYFWYLLLMILCWELILIISFYACFLYWFCWVGIANT